jgi:hypothetical protein
VEEEREGHDHAASEGGWAGDGVNSFAGREVEYVDLIVVRLWLDCGKEGEGKHAHGFGAHGIWYCD